MCVEISPISVSQGDEEGLVPSPSKDFLNWAEKGSSSVQGSRSRIKKDFTAASRKSYCPEEQRDLEVKRRREISAERRVRNKNNMDF